MKRNRTAAKNVLGRALRAVLAGVLVGACLPAAALAALPLDAYAAGAVSSASGAVAMLEAAASNASTETFSAQVGDITLYFATMGEDAADGNPAVAVGRGNASGGDDLALDDLAFSGTLSIPETVEHDGVTYTVTEIQDYAFSSGNSGNATVSALTAVEVPATVTEIGDFAFCRNTALATLSFAEGSQLASIGERAFFYCSSLEAVDFPASVETIGAWAFAYSPSLASVTFAEGSKLTTLGDSAFYCYKTNPGSIAEIVLPEGVKRIPDGAFANQTSLASVTIVSETVEYIGSHAFDGCTSLTTFTFPAFDTDEAYPLGTYALANCTSLETVIFIGDVVDYDFNVNNGHWIFFGDTISKVVFHGTSLSFSSEDGQGSSDTFGEVTSYYNVSFYGSKDDAEAGENELGSIRVREDVTVSQIKNNSFEDDQLFDDGGTVPDTSANWVFEGDLANTDVISDSCWAYAAAADDIAGCTVSLNATSFRYTGADVGVTWTVAAADGSVLEEGTDYSVSVTRYDEDEEANVAQEVGSLVEEGTYTVTFSGKGSYSGSVTATFSIVAATIDWDCIAGASEAEVAAKVCAQLYDPDEESFTYAILVGEGDAQSAAAALPVASLLNAPILVTASDELSEVAAVQLRRLGVSQVIVVGDASAVSADVVSDVQSLWTRPSCSRVTPGDDAGAALYSAFKSQGMGDADVAYVVASDDATLAAAVASVAYENASPILFCEEDGTLSGATRSVLKTGGFSEVVVVGGTSASLSKIKSQVGNSLIAYSQVTGTSSEIALSLAQDAFDSAGSARLDVVYGSAALDAGVDAASAALYAARSGSVLLLAEDEASAQASVDELVGDKAASVESLRFVGQRASLPQEVVDTVCAVWYAGYSLYPDVDAGEWCAQYINMTTDAGYMSGYSTGYFGPDDMITRADVAVVIWRACGSDTGNGFNYSYSAAFSDVDSSAYYATAVNWCAASGIFTGDAGTTNMRPNDPITREELATVMMRFLSKQGVTVNEASLDDIEGLVDGSSVSSWASSAMAWAYSQGFITGYDGYSGVVLGPQDSATRAQMAKIIVVACEEL